MSQHRYFYFSRGSDCLRTVLKHYNSACGISKILAPNYMCSVVMQAIKLEGYSVETYDIDIITMEPKYDEIEHCVDKTVFMYCNYFGHLGNVENAVEFCRKNGIHLIEDLCHWANGIKWLPIDRPAGDFQFNSVRKFTKFRFGAELKANAIYSDSKPDSVVKYSIKNYMLDTFKVIIKKFLAKIRININAIKAKEMLSYAYGHENLASSIYRLDYKYQEKLKNVLNQRDRRNEQQKKWEKIRLLSESYNVVPKFVLQRDDCPMYFVGVVDPINLEKTLSLMHLDHIYAHTWPSLYDSGDSYNLTEATITLRNSLIFITL